MNELIRMPDSAEKTQVPESRYVSQIYDTAAGDEIFALAAEIYPICRSITGNGVRETLRILGRYIDIFMNEVPTGTESLRLDHSARMEHSQRLYQGCGGQTVVDFADLNLHVMSYSIPVRKHVPCPSSGRTFTAYPSSRM